MHKRKIIILIACLAILGLASPTQAQEIPEMVTRDEALTVAQNWITVITYEKGDWGGTERAEVEDVQEFRRGERVLGYFCQVSPQGFIIVSLRRELAPVKAYSAINDLDPESDEGMADLLKRGMERILDAVETQFGPIESVQSADLQGMLEIDYRQSWERLARDVETFKSDLESDVIIMNYQESDVLLSTAWHQDDPYNQLCPIGNTGCTDCCPSDPTQVCNPTLPTAVGCVATAGAQIMNFWSWPPYGVGSHSYTWNGDDTCGSNVGGGTLSATFSDSYDWRHIANQYLWDAGQNRWENENGDPLTQAHLDAVAELSYEFGVAVEMDYGVCGSGIFYPCNIIEDVYEDYFRYSGDSHNAYRDNYTAVDWFNLMKTQFNVNRPVQYIVTGHCIVGDGWQEIGAAPIRQYHMNYGWGQAGICQGCNAWYTLDALHLGDHDIELMYLDIYPAQALGSYLSGTYARDTSFPYRYVDRDATGQSATFASGQYIQFLAGVTVECTSTTGGSISVQGSSSSSTQLFTRGDRTRGIHIYNGEIKLYRHGSIKFH